MKNKVPFFRGFTFSWKYAIMVTGVNYFYRKGKSL